jgi:hypothetical protein
MGLPRGRPKGSISKVSASVKENIMAVFVRMGSTCGMANWAKENPTEFYKIYARLIPQEVEAKVENSGQVSLGNESALAERLAKHLANRQVSS